MRLLQMDGFDDCIIGIVTIAGRDPVLCYDRAKVLASLVENNDFTEEEAQEFHDFNQAGAYLGEGTPALIDLDSPKNALLLAEELNND